MFISACPDFITKEIIIRDTEFTARYHRQQQNICGCYCIDPIIQAYTERNLNPIKPLALYFTYNFALYQKSYLNLKRALSVIDEVGHAAQHANYMPYERYHYCVKNQIEKNLWLLRKT